MIPAVVRFVGNESEYICSCGETETRYCHLCERCERCSMKDSQPKQFTFGNEYAARIVEYWEGVRNGLQVEDNNRDGYVSFIPFEDFEIVTDPDNVLNSYEAEVRCIAPDYDGSDFDLITGAVYKAIGRDRSDHYLVMDESLCCYFYPANEFEIVDDPHGILRKESLCYHYFDDSDEPDYVIAHAFCSNHKPELSKDCVCGCFECLKIFNPEEIEEWVFADNQADKRGTAICPYCGVDSVIGESAGFPITVEFLQKMHDYWFNS